MTYCILLSLRFVTSVVYPLDVQVQRHIRPIFFLAADIRAEIVLLYFFSSASFLFLGFDLVFEVGIDPFVFFYFLLHKYLFEGDFFERREQNLVGQENLPELHVVVGCRVECGLLDTRLQLSEEVKQVL